MLARLWRVVPGPAWAKSVAEANAHDGYFDDNLEAMDIALALDPYGHSRPFLDDRDDARVFTTKDVAAGYRVVVFFRLDPPNRMVELGWLELEPLDPRVE